MRKIASTNYENQQRLHELCDAAFTLSCISGRWKLTLLVQLLPGQKRFSELKQAIPLITERILSLQLKELEQAGLLARRQEAGTKLYTYELSGKGQSLAPVIHALSVWGKKHKTATVSG
jgi:DNA-binding HxlR family transcriptional regulator